MSRHRDIRSERARELQGLRAGFFSRAVASGTDVLLVLCVYVGGVVVASIAWDLFFSQSVSVSVPPHWLNVLILWIVLVVYLASGWHIAGRTLGKQMMGLRVVFSNGSRLRFPRALLRATLCATFFPVLLLALVDRRNRGLEAWYLGRSFCMTGSQRNPNRSPPDKWTDSSRSRYAGCRFRSHADEVEAVLPLRLEAVVEANVGAEELPETASWSGSACSYQVG